MKKKILVLLLASVLSLSMVACGEDSNVDTNETPQEMPAEDNTQDMPEEEPAQESPETEVEETE